jgi:hypothetical protein
LLVAISRETKREGRQKEKEGETMLQEAVMMKLPAR